MLDSSDRPTACGLGLRCSSTGVPTTTTTASAREMTAGSALAESSPSASACSQDRLGAVLLEGQPPALTRSTAASLMS